LEASGLAIFPLPETGLVNIGRGEDCEVRIQDALVSRRHAILRLNPLTIEDAGSANGTKLGTERLSAGAAVPIHAGQAISVGRSLLIVRRATTSADAETNGASSRGEFDTNIVVCDPAMKKIYSTVERLAQGQINVLILGETGVGKEVIAEAIHRASPRRDLPLLRLNCASLSEALLESELFGHERGAFTGASATKPGLIELADRGTVFLDEVGELSRTLQAKLLRLIETRETMRIGGLKPRAVDVRFLFATNRDLEADVSAGRFRADLYFRLKGAVVEVPPLRERRSEILPLAEACVARAAAQMQFEVVPRLSGDAQTRLLAHSWPGNVRELRNAIERAVLLCNAALIDAEDLALDTLASPERVLNDAAPTELPPALLDSERDRIAQALVECGGNQSRAAESLGIPRRTFVRKLAELGLPRPRRPN
jgi:DNA-binding NtrC family response regulator